jgi:hypothetical protein
LKMAKDTLAVLEIPKKDVTILPGHGWRPPDADIVKINTDGGLPLVARQGGSGGVARTHTTFLGAWSKPYPGVTDSLVAEALALWDGVLFARLRGYRRVVMETEVVNLWNTRCGSRSVVAPILLELEELSTSSTFL